MRVFHVHERYGVPRINIYLLRALFVLMAVFLGNDAWSHITSHEGAWNPEAAMAWTVWAAFSLLAGIGVFHPLKMLPIVLLEIVYKMIWLVVVAYPLWSDGALDGRAEEMAGSFALVVLPILATPWKYVFENYLKHERTLAAGGTVAAELYGDDAPRRPTHEPSGASSLGNSRNVGVSR